MESRGANALQRRAQQLARWAELEAEAETEEPKVRSPRIQFSAATLFLAAANTGDVAECRRLLAAGVVDVDVANVDGLTALHQVRLFLIKICANQISNPGLHRRQSGHGRLSPLFG